jgi:DNA-binding NarL/FixJ family response regulator
MSGKIRVALADDHPIVLAGLRNLLMSETDIELVGDAKTGYEALKLMLASAPDIAVIDISMPELNGISIARKLAQDAAHVRVVILTLYEDRAFLKQAFAAGVRGYVLKRAAAENLVDAVRRVADGQTYVDPFFAEADRAIGLGAKGRLEELARLGLTEREAEALKFAARGLTNKETAARLGISEKSVESYRARATEKLDLKTRADIVRFAAAQGWLNEV